MMGSSRRFLVPRIRALCGYDNSAPPVLTSFFTVGTDGLGNAHVVGYTDGEFPGQTSSGSTDAFVRKYDANGNEVWTRQFGTSAQDLALAGNFQQLRGSVCRGLD